MSDPAKEENLEAETAYGYLLVDVARLYKTLFNRRFQPLFGLTQAQSRTLIHLARSEGINQAGLAELLEIQPITLARAIDRLEADGWVERRQDPNDRRAFTLHLLPKAQPALDEIRELGLALSEEAANSLTTEERLAFVRTLEVMRNNIAVIDSRNEKKRPEQETAGNAATSMKEQVQ